MTARWPGRFASVACLPIIAVLVAVPGCRKQDPGFEVMTLEGTIEKIKLTDDDAGEITVTYYSEKHGQEMEGIGLVTPETEIMINGAVAKLKDLREGERVRGEVRIEKENDKKRQIALKIYIDRTKPIGSEGG